MERADGRHGSRDAASFTGFEGSHRRRLRRGFQSHGKRIASAAGDRTVKIWNSATGVRITTLNEATAELYCVAFRPGSTQVAAGGVDRIVRVWDSESGTMLHAAFAHDGPILKLAYTSDGTSLVTAGQDRAVKLWSAETLAGLRDLPRQTEWPQALAVGKQRIAVGCQDGSLHLYDLSARALSLAGLTP